jgi:hypothetical protein
LSTCSASSSYSKSTNERERKGYGGEKEKCELFPYTNFHIEKDTKITVGKEEEEEEEEEEVHLLHFLC